MGKVEMTYAELVEFITKLVLKTLGSEEPQIPLGVSNRHVHLSRADMDALFGKGSSLTKLKDLKQPGQYACKEQVSIVGPKGRIEKVRVLGPLRDETQVEVSTTDTFALGIKPFVRESGKIDKTAPIGLEGPKGAVSKSQGAIVALRHIHMPKDIADNLGFKDKEYVNVEVGDSRGAILKNVLLRVSDNYALEMHLDTDEANALGVKNDDVARIVKD